MRGGHNAHCDRFIPIDDGERESVQDESARSVLIGRPTSRPLGQDFRVQVNLGEESGTRLIISSSIPKPRLFPPLAMPADGNGRAYLLASDSRAASGVFLRGVEAAWSEEIKRRIEDIDSGKVQMIPYLPASSLQHLRFIQPRHSQSLHRSHQILTNFK